MKHISITSSSFTSTIDLHLLYLTNSTHTQRLPSDIPSPEHLNPRLASRIPNGSRFTATIPSRDFQSFVTDHHQKWLSQQQTSRLPAYSPDFLVDQEADFVLFPTSTDHPQVRRLTGWTPVASPLVPSLESVKTVHGHPQPDQRHKSVLQTSASDSPVFNTQARKIVHDTGSRASSASVPRLNSLGQRSHFYASSAPSSSVNLRPDNHQRTRPPVPLFHNSTGNMNVQTLSDSPQTLLEGKTATSTPLTALPLTRSGSDMSPRMSPEFYHLSANFDGINPDLSSMVSLDNLDDFELHLATTPFQPVNQRMAATVSPSVHTVSPKDLMLDTTSAPPSTSLTNLTTPGTNYMESPQYEIESTRTSPLFGTENLGAEAEYWPSLFTDGPGDDMENIGKKSPLPNTHVAPPMSRYGSSGQLSSTGSHQANHASSNGVAAKRRDKPLPAITIEDPTDIIAVKRARNTMAARKSRQRRLERTEELQKLVTDLEKQVDRWKQIALSYGHVEHEHILDGQSD